MFFKLILTTTVFLIVAVVWNQRCTLYIALFLINMVLLYAFKNISSLQFSLFQNDWTSPIQNYIIIFNDKIFKLTFTKENNSQTRRQKIFSTLRFEPTTRGFGSFVCAKRATRNQLVARWFYTTIFTQIGVQWKFVKI